jgi:hypothetical protein
VKIRVQNSLIFALTLTSQPVIDANQNHRRLIAEGRPDFTAPTTINEIQKALAGNPLEKVVLLAPIIQG